MSPSSPGRARRALDRLDASVAGLVGALLLVAGIGTYLAVITPAYRQDESSHVGYTIEVREGNLPTITTPVRGEGDSAEMRAALARPYPFSDPEIHVANNPPFVYALAVPVTSATRALDVPGGGLLGFRLLGVAGATAGIGLCFLLGRELSGGDRFVGLVTAASMAGLLSVVFVSSLAALDGPALAATTGVTWAMARHARRTAPSTALLLGLLCAAAAAVRPMALALAAVAGLLGLGAHVARRGWRSFPGAALRIGGPTVVLVGWFYVLNVRRYGDPTGGSALFDKYGWPPGPGFWSVLWSPVSLLDPLHHLIAQLYGRDAWFVGTGVAEWVVAVAAVGSVIAAIVIAVRDSRRPDRPDGGAASESGPVPLAWALTAVVAVVPVLLLTRHVSGGGGGHPRYLIPTLPVVAAAAAMVTARIHRWASVALVSVLVTVELTRIRAAGRIHYEGEQLFGPLLNSPIMGPPARWAGLGLAAGGTMLLMTSLIVMAGRAHPRRDPPSRAPAGDDPVPC